MRIALTGGSGFIGKWIIKELADEHEFVVLGRSRAITQLSVGAQPIRYLNTDYGTTSLMATLKNVDAVVHLAARRPGLKSTSETFQDFLPNIEIASNLFEVCTVLNIKNIVNISSISVYGLNNPLPWSEAQRCFPESYYGVAKLCTEHLANYYNRQKGTAIKSLRVAQVVGVGEREGFLLMTFINKARRQETLQVFGTGTGQREYIYVKDVASAVGAAIKTGNSGGCFNIGTGKTTAHKDLAEMINTVFENQGTVTFLQDKPEDPSRHLMDVNKAGRELHWQAEWSLEAALEDMKHIFASKLSL